jgi:membrane associated rhomboid family serine protease
MKPKQLMDCRALIIIIVLTLTVTCLQFVSPEILSTLRRSPVGLEAGEWWRIITPLFVDSEGFLHFTLNIVSIVVLGVTVERLFGGFRFMLLYFIGGVSGEIAGYAWDPNGAGASVGLCGLMGGLFVMLLLRKGYIRPMISLWALYIIAGFSFETRNTIVSIGLVVLVVVLQLFLNIRKYQAKLLGPIMAIVGILGAITLIVLHDIHGPATLAGVGVAVVMLIYDYFLVAPE